jgi:hypothetical protein
MWMKGARCGVLVGSLIRTEIPSKPQVDSHSRPRVPPHKSPNEERPRSQSYQVMEFPEQITIGLVFFRFAYVVSLGFWQVLAAHLGLRAFSLLPRGLGKVWSYVVGGAIMAAAGVFFLGTRAEEIFSPGPASSEFLFFLFLALFCGLFTCLVFSSAEDALSFFLRRRSNETGGAYREPVSTRWWEGTLHLPLSGRPPYPVVCVVARGEDAHSGVPYSAEALAREGTAVLIIDLCSGGMWQYPDVLAATPQAVALAEEREELDASRLGVLGVGLGADLAIRAAASDEQIKALAVISPVLDVGRVEPGLDLLSDMSYLDAIRWRRRNGDARLVEQLEAVEWLPLVHPRPCLVIHAQKDAVERAFEEAELPSSTRIVGVPGEGRIGVGRSPAARSLTADWFLEHL